MKAMLLASAVLGLSSAHAVQVQVGLRPLVQSVVTALPRDEKAAQALIPGEHAANTVLGVLARLDSLKPEDKKFAYAAIARSLVADHALGAFAAKPEARPELVIKAIRDRFREAHQDAVRIAGEYESGVEEDADPRGVEDDLARADALLGAERIFLGKDFREPLEAVRPSLAERVSETRFGVAKGRDWSALAEQLPVGEAGVNVPPAIAESNKRVLLDHHSDFEFAVARAKVEDGHAVLKLHVDHDGRINPIDEPRPGFVEIPLRVRPAGHIVPIADAPGGPLAASARGAVRWAISAYNRHNSARFAPLRHKATKFDFPNGASFDMELGPPGDGIIVHFRRDKAGKVEVRYDPGGVNRERSQKFGLGYHAQIIGVGGEPGNLIVIRDSHVAGRHVELRLTEGAIEISDVSGQGARVKGLKPSPGQ